MYAYKRALRQGADVIELDVHMTADGHVVAIHDETVDRTTNGSGSVEEMTLAQVKRLDAAYWFVFGVGTAHGHPTSAYRLRGVATGDRPPPGGFRPSDFTIPTLREVLATFPRTYVNIELKPTSRQTGQLELAVARLLAEFGRETDVIVVSFLDHSLELFKAIAPNVHTATATGNAAVFHTTARGPGAPNPRYVALQVPESFLAIEVLTPDFVADAHRNGLAVHPWTINEKEAMTRLLDWGVDGIMTDRPTRLEAILDRRGTLTPAR